MRPRKTTFVINDSTCGGLKSLTIKTIKVRKKGFAGDVFTLARVKTPPKSATLFFKTGKRLFKTLGARMFSILDR